MIASSRYLVVGLDGATFDLLDPWFAAGELPFLRQMASGGMRAPLASVFPAKTIPAWYSFATGQDPGSLGIFGFTEPDGGPGRSKLVQTFRPNEAFWDRLSRVGRNVGVLGFPVAAGYPLHGFVVPGMLGDAPPTYPDDLRTWIEASLKEPLAPELPPYRDAERRSWMELATRAVEQRGRTAEILLDRFRSEFLFVLFRETDRVQHQHWTELDRPFAQIPDDLRRFWRAVDAACARIDGAFRRDERPATTLIISDHGHGAARAEFFTNRWLHEQGYLRFRNGGDSRRRRLVSRVLIQTDRFPAAGRILRVAADRLRGSPKIASVTDRISGPASFEAMAPEIDWEHTAAFSYPVPEGIYLNPYNPHLTPEDKTRVVGEIRAKLGRETQAHIETFVPSEIYRGRSLAKAPSLFLRIDGMETQPRVDFSYPSPHLRERPSFFYGSGVHRMNGILLASGPTVPTRRVESPLSLLDIAPTVLEGMGVAPPPSMVGRSFAAWLGPVA